MPGVARFIGLAASILLALGSLKANAERITFESVAPSTSALEIFQGHAAYIDRIYGELRLPAKGSAPFPAMVIMHSSRGVDDTVLGWARLLNDMGIASFVVDSFTPRGLSQANASRLTWPADVADTLRALRTLRNDARIEANNIGVMGFSLGAIGAMEAGFERYRAALVGIDGGKFAFHIVFYGGCSQYAKTTGSPILTFLGTKDDFNNVAVCRKYTELINQQGTKAELVVYEGAPHEFDTDYPLQYMPMIQNSRNCAMLQNLDTFEAMLVDGRALTPEERLHHSQSCRGSGASRGGDRRFVAPARERVRQFVAEQFGLPR